LDKELTDSPMNVSVTLSSQINMITLANKDQEQIASNTDTIIVESPFSGILVSFIQRKNEFNNYRTLDFVIYWRQDD
jgi:hypothetical protein